MKADGVPESPPPSGTSLPSPDLQRHVACACSPGGLNSTHGSAWALWGPAWLRRSQGQKSRPRGN